jgi:hypothetical protein
MRRSRGSTSRGPKGQALVLFTLCLLLLTVLVMMTLSIGTRVRDKLELDNLSEVAAYNDAVVVARTYNSISLLNRAQLSHMVALAGVQSLISWSGLYRGALGATHAGLDQAKQPHAGECDDKGLGCGCASRDEIEGLEKIVLKEAERVGKTWELLDAAAGNQAHEIREETLRIYADELSIYGDQLESTLADQHLGQQLVARARAGQAYPDELSAPATAAVATREVGMSMGCGPSPSSSSGSGAAAYSVGGGATSGSGGSGSGASSSPGAACAPFAQNAHAVWAAMGTRGYKFVTARNNDTIVARIMELMPPGVEVTGTANGSAFFSEEDSHGEASKTNQQAWAHDHMGVTVTYKRAKGKCTKVTKGYANATAYVRSSRRVGDEAHAWTGGQDIDPVSKHTVGGGMWPSFIDYNTALLTNPADNYGQPKMYAVMQRNYAVRGTALPWEQRFGLRFTTSGSSETSSNALDMRGRALSTSMATGVAYYHRGMHWREPPNFFNPFWRASLMAADVDAQSSADVPATLGAANNSSGARAFMLLKQKGYRGF